MTRIGVALAAVTMVAFGGLTGAGAGASASVRPTVYTGPRFLPAIDLAGSDGATEPRVTIDPSGHRWIVSNSGGLAVVYGSTSGRTWTKTPADMPDQQFSTIDTDIVSTHTGRIIAAELDYVGINFRIAYSDDAGATWAASTGAKFADTDRPFLAVGPDDPVSHKATVYLLFHNLFSGEAGHNMYVQTSTDGGATFGLPVPTTLPGSQAYLDLQCADSGGPSNIFVNQSTGQVYAVFGTRSSEEGGGCGAAAVHPQINVVAATRVWVVTSPNGLPGTWTQSLAVDDSTPGNMVGMQLAPGTLDSVGNVYVFYPESPNAYPDYEHAAMRYRHAPADLSNWSAPVTVAKGTGDGNILPHVVAGAPGEIDFAYFHGVNVAGGKPVWYPMVAQTLNGLAAHPSFTHVRLANVPTYNDTASVLMGVCSDPVGGLTCGRSTDVWGVALDPNCYLAVTWPSTANGAAGSVNGTWASTQKSGPVVC